jgi:hypothetical protein
MCSVFLLQNYSNTANVPSINEFINVKFEDICQEYCGTMRRIILLTIDKV